MDFVFLVDFVFENYNIECWRQNCLGYLVLATYFGSNERSRKENGIKVLTNGYDTYYRMWLRLTK